MDNLQEILAKISNIQAKFNSEMEELKEAITQLTSSSETDTPTKEEWFDALLSCLTIKKLEEYPDSLFYMNGDKFIFEHETNRRHILVSPDIWAIFKSEYGMKYNEIADFVSCILKKQTFTNDGFVVSNNHNFDIKKLK